MPDRFEAKARLGIGPHTEVWRWVKGGRPALAAVIPGPFDVLSVSPDGQRFFLRRFGIAQAGGFPPVGPPPGWAFLYDAASKHLQRLDGISGWLSPQWLADGTLLVSGSFGGGASLVRVGPDGRLTALVRDRAVADYLVSPDGKRVAAFVESEDGNPDAAGDIGVINLTTGDREDWKGAVTFPRTPNGVAEVFARWSPDGKYLFSL